MASSDNVNQFGVPSSGATPDEGRPRKANFSDAEIRAMIAAYDKFSAVLNSNRTCPRTEDRIAHDTAWQSVLASVNSVAESGTVRTLQEVKKKWIRLKTTAKKERQDTETAQRMGYQLPTESWFTPDVLRVIEPGNPFSPGPSDPAAPSTQFAGLVSSTMPSSQLSAGPIGTKQGDAKNKDAVSGGGCKVFFSDGRHAGTMQSWSQPLISQLTQQIMSEGRTRKANFSDAEVRALLTEYSKYLHVMKTSGKGKKSHLFDFVWKVITDSVNQVAKKNVTRTELDVKKKWKNLKATATKERQESEAAKREGRPVAEESWFTPQVLKLMPAESDKADGDEDSGSDSGGLEEIDFQTMMTLVSSPEKGSDQSERVVAAEQKSSHEDDQGEGHEPTGPGTNGADKVSTARYAAHSSSSAAKNTCPVPHFLDSESTCLLEGVLKHIRCLAVCGSYRSGQQLAQQQLAWRTITDNINKLALSSAPRSVKQVKKHFAGLRRALAKAGQEKKLPVQLTPKQFKLLQQIRRAEGRAKRASKDSQHFSQQPPGMDSKVVMGRQTDTSDVDDTPVRKCQTPQTVEDSGNTSLQASGCGDTTQSLEIKQWWSDLKRAAEEYLQACLTGHGSNLSPSPSFHHIMEILKSAEHCSARSESWKDRPKAENSMGDTLSSSRTGNNGLCVKTEGSTPLKGEFSDRNDAVVVDEARSKSAIQSIHANKAKDEELLMEYSSESQCLDSLPTVKEEEMTVDTEDSWTADTDSETGDEMQDDDDESSDEVSSTESQIKHHLRAIAYSWNELKTLGVELKMQIAKNSTEYSTVAEILGRPSHGQKASTQSMSPSSWGHQQPMREKTDDDDDDGHDDEEVESLPITFAQRQPSRGSNQGAAAEVSSSLPPLSRKKATRPKGRARGQDLSAGDSSRVPTDGQSSEYCCEECGKLFASKTRLICHRRTHSGVKPFACDQCPRTFVSRRNFKTHKDRHQGIIARPFQCDVCGRRFTAKNNMLTHLRIHTGDRPHRCGYCGESFVAPIQLKFHVAKHTGYRPHVCEICGKGFVEANRLRKHQLTHTAEKRFNCEVCEKWFTEKRGLDVHMRLHMSDGPYMCPVCAKPNQSASKLKKHLRTHKSTTNFLPSNEIP